jgi:hypothetical protein
MTPVDVGTVPARLELFGFPSTPARLSLTTYPRGRRLFRAARPLLIALAVAVPLTILTLGFDLVFTPLALLMGGLFARRAWHARHEVRYFEGRCPRCDRALELRPGRPIGIPHTLDCFGCHSHPRLVAALPPSADA